MRLTLDYKQNNYSTEVILLSLINRVVLIILMTLLNQFIGFWRKLLVVDYDNKNQGFTRSSITTKKKQTN
jgi:hypothetical protein